MFRRHLGEREFGADGPRQIGVVGFPGFRGRIAERGFAKLGESGFGIAVQQFGEVVDIDAAGLIQGDGKRVGRGCDQRYRGRGDHALAEDRPHTREAVFEIIVLDARDQPTIGIVGEGREVRPPMALALFAGLRIHRNRDDRLVDWPETAHERCVGDAQPDLGLRPWLIGCLRAKHIAYRVADRQQCADNLRVAGASSTTASRISISA